MNEQRRTSRGNDLLMEQLRNRDAQLFIDGTQYLAELPRPETFEEKCQRLIAEIDKRLTREVNQGQMRSSAADHCRSYVRGELTLQELNLVSRGPMADWVITTVAELNRKPIEFSKSVFVNALNPSPELMTILEPLTEKADILKAVFDFNNSAAPKPIELTPATRAMKNAIKIYNASVDERYLSRLRSFHDAVHGLIGEDSELLEYVSNEKEIEQGNKLGEEMFKHRLFKVVRLYRRGPRRQPVLYMDIVTREDVFFSFMGNRLNFGKYSFNLTLDGGNAGKVRFLMGASNFHLYAGPYIANDSVCLGENVRSVQNAIREGRLEAAMTELYTVMTQYNPDSSPYCALDRFFQDVKDGRLFRNNKQMAYFVGQEPSEPTPNPSNLLSSSIENLEF